MRSEILKITKLSGIEVRVNNHENGKKKNDTTDNAVELLSKRHSSIPGLIPIR